MTCYHSLMRQLQSCEKDIVTFLQKRKTSWQRNPCNKPDLTLTRLDLTSVEMIVPSGTCARLSSVTIHLESLKCRGVTQASDLYAEFSWPAEVPEWFMLYRFSRFRESRQGSKKAASNDQTEQFQPKAYRQPTAEQPPSLVEKKIVSCPRTLPGLDTKLECVRRPFWQREHLFTLRIRKKLQ